MTNKYSQKLFDSAKKSTRDAIITAPKTVIQKAAEATSYLIGNKKKNKCFKKVAFKKIAFKNRWKQNRNSKRKIYISRIKATNYWRFKIRII